MIVKGTTTNNKEKRVVYLKTNFMSYHTRRMQIYLMFVRIYLI